MWANGEYQEWLAWDPEREVEVGKLLIKKGNGLVGAEKLKKLDFLPLPEQGNTKEESIGSSNSQHEEECCSSKGNESIASPGEENNFEESDGDIEIEELSESDSLDSIEIKLETSTAVPLSKESEGLGQVETGLKTLLDGAKSKEKFHVGEKVLCYEPHFYMMHKATIVSRSKRKGCYWVKFDGWRGKKNVEIPRDLVMQDTPANLNLMEEVNKVKEESGEGVKFFDGEEVLCYEPNLNKVNKIYKAKILGVLRPRDGETDVSYLVHFPGWGKKHNRRVDCSMLLKDIPVHRELMKRLNLMMDQRISKKRKTKKTKKISAEQRSYSPTNYNSQG